MAACERGRGGERCISQLCHGVFATPSWSTYPVEGDGEREAHEEAGHISRRADEGGPDDEVEADGGGDERKHGEDDEADAEGAPGAVPLLHLLYATW